jgi:hypothetical protein
LEKLDSQVNRSNNSQEALPLEHPGSPTNIYEPTFSVWGPTGNVI